MMPIYELAYQITKLAESTRAGDFGTDVADTEKLAKEFKLILTKYKELTNSDVYEITEELSPIKFIQQPPGSNLCGQTCVAMILGASLEEIIEVLGRGRTRTTQLVSILESNGFKCYPSLRRVFTGWRDYVVKNKAFAICKVPCVYDGKKSSHWVLFYDGKIYDPCWSGVVNTFLGWPTSFLMVWKENK
ncbi:MAG: hypothetical protein ACFFFC_00680 [Candidatus Thorarchaeota archaeon]